MPNEVARGARQQFIFRRNNNSNKKPYDFYHFNRISAQFLFILHCWIYSEPCSKKVYVDTFRIWILL